MNGIVYDMRTVTPLGVWLWDALTDGPVLDELEVVAVPLDSPGDETKAIRTPSGVRAFTGLAGLRRVEYPLGDEDPLGAPLHSASFAVCVDDRAGRFNPATIILDAPQAGIAGLGSPPGGPTYLFASPARRFAAGVAVVRADLVNRATGEPAAHARVDVIVAGRRWAGTASDRGAVAVAFPYPGFGGAPSPSPPPGTGGTPPGLQTWPIAVEVRHDPPSLDFPVAERPPDLASIFGQASVDIWLTHSGPSVAALDAQLLFGAELVLRTGAGPVLEVGGTSP